MVATKRSLPYDLFYWLCLYQAPPQHARATQKTLRHNHVGRGRSCGTVPHYSDSLPHLLLFVAGAAAAPPFSTALNLLLIVRFTVRSVSSLSIRLSRTGRQGSGLSRSPPIAAAAARDIPSPPPSACLKPPRSIQVSLNLNIQYQLLLSMPPTKHDVFICYRWPIRALGSSNYCCVVLFSRDCASDLAIRRGRCHLP